MNNAILIEAEDNVVVAIELIKSGEDVNYINKNDEETSLKALNDIRIYHKIAKTDIAKGDHVVKYGEHIGEASQDIKVGEHVHEHNVVGVREDLKE